MEYLIRNIKKGINFELLDESVAGFHGRYLGRFLEYRENSFLISIPKMGEREYNFKKGERIVLYIYAPEGVYNFESDVLNVNEDTCEISLPISMKHSQRREFLRADLKLKMNLSYTDKFGIEESYEVKTVNVCGRGVCVTLPKDITGAKNIEVELFLSEEIVETDAVVVYIRPIETIHGLMFSTALTFTTISEQKINSIVRECFLFKLKSSVEEHSKW